VIPALLRIDGVRRVTPRIVGEVILGKDRHPAVLVGLPPENFPPTVTCIEGRLPHTGGPNELVVGRQLARRLGLHVGSRLPPFYHYDAGERVSEVVGLFASDVSLWEADLVFTTFDTAAAIFNQKGLATDLLVDCRPGEQAQVTAQIVRTPVPGRGHTDLRITAREDLRALLPAGLLHREGVFNLHFVLAFAAGILVMAVTSGFGLSGRRREIGILKATGWQTDEVLLRGLAESLLLALAAASASVLLAYAWLRWLNGYGVAAYFLVGVDPRPAFRVPYQLAPFPALMGFVLAIVLVTTGTVYSSWRAATVPPREALR
jgi:ABC-type lipoprotein release transport system permease subunit